MKKIKDESKFIGNWLVYMILGYAVIFLSLLFVPLGRTYDVTIAVLPTIPAIILIVITMWYAKTSYQILETSKKETAVRDIREKLKNFYTPLNTRYFVDNVVSNREQIFFNHLKTKDYKEYYMDRPEKESFLKLIGDNLHFADDDLEQGLNEIRYSTNDFTIPRERCNEIANLIKTGYEKYKKEYEELISPKNDSSST